jgi:hypothetical protein
LRLSELTPQRRGVTLEGEKVTNENSFKSARREMSEENSPDQLQALRYKNHLERWTARWEVLVRVASYTFKDCSFACRAWDSHFGRRRTSKMLYVTTSAALPRKGPFSSRGFDLSKSRVSLIANRRQCDYQRVERRVRKFNSSC